MIYLGGSQYFNLWPECQSLHLHSILTSAFLRPSKCITPTLKIRWSLCQFRRLHSRWRYSHSQIGSQTCSLLPSVSPPTDRQPSGNSTVFGNVLCADSVTLCRAHPLFGDVDGRSARPRPYSKPQVKFRLVRNHHLPSLTGNCQCSFSRTY